MLIPVGATLVARDSVIEAVKAIEEERFTGGVHVGTLETGEVGLAPFYGFDSLISADVKADLEQIKQEVAESKAAVEVATGSIDTNLIERERTARRVASACRS